MRQLVPLFLVALAPCSVQAADEFLLRDGQRVVFLGDSNTFAGTFIAYLDAYLFTRFPGQRFELLNLGLPSETVSGLSEPDHPYPRPDAHERLERVLTRTRPDIVVACYGMNDGIYSPPSEERLAKYQDGLRRLIDQAQKAGARVVLMTPAPFDPLPLGNKVLPATAEKFSWMRPFEGYDRVLTRYSEWLLTLRGKRLVVADPHAAMLRYLAEKRRSEPAYVLSRDGIHPSATGHWLIAAALLEALKAPAEVDRVEIDARAGKAVHGQVRDLKADPASLRFTWTTRLPLPADPRWDSQLAAQQRIADRFNHQRLVVTGLERERWLLSEGDRRLGEVTREQLAAGLDLTAYPALSTNERSSALWKLVEQRQKLLGLAWLTDVGHRRPDTPKGLPLADAQKQADDLEKQIRTLARPATLGLRLESSRE